MFEKMKARIDPKFFERRSVYTSHGVQYTLPHDIEFWFDVITDHHVQLYFCKEVCTKNGIMWPIFKEFIMELDSVHMPKYTEFLNLLSSLDISKE